MEWMPKTNEGTAVTGHVSAEAAMRTGLAAGTPVVGGGGDQGAQAVGVGAVEPGIVALTVGTSGVVFAPLSEYAYEPQGRLHAFCHAAPGLWHFMGVMLSAAGSFQWYRDTLAPDLSFDALTKEANHAPPGSDGLLFLPYLTGERTPHPDPLARGAFVGLTARHTRGHLTRAVLEGVAFGLRDGFELIKSSQAGKTINEIRVSGGGARSALWLQIMADIFDAPLVKVEALEGAAYGAALLAGVGVGVWPDIKAAAQVVKTGEVTTPSKNVEAYEARYALYRNLYPTLKETFRSLTD
jgi:xylulokinase